MHENEADFAGLLQRLFWVVCVSTGMAAIALTHVMRHRHCNVTCKWVAQCDQFLKEHLHLQEFNPQSLSNVLWAFASLKHHPGDALLDASANHAVRCVDQFTPQVCPCILHVSVCICSTWLLVDNHVADRVKPICLHAPSIHDCNKLGSVCSAAQLICGSLHLTNSELMLLMF